MDLGQVFNLNNAISWGLAGFGLYSVINPAPFLSIFQSIPMIGATVAGLGSSPIGAAVAAIIFGTAFLVFRLNPKNPIGK